MSTPWTLTALPWESKFLQQELWRLKIDSGFTESDWFNGALPALRKVQDSALCEAVLDSTCIHHSRLLEDEGFRLCDSKFQFLTKVKANELPPVPATIPDGHAIRDYQDKDLEAVLTLTEQELVQNPLLITKFKSPWFPSDTPSRWYSAWIQDVMSKGGLCSVLVNAQEKVVGYFAYLQGQDLSGIPVFKGILTAIEPKARGGRVHLAMQDHLFRNAIRHPEFWLDNTTQISNRPVYRNHVNSGRKPHSISLIFLRGGFA
ncbi:MAG: hypothetical protein L7S67_06165 [Flavobacteriales bacterium]|nr:hypothetical protein [Flavobacteriales bacterium]